MRSNTGLDFLWNGSRYGQADCYCGIQRACSGSNTCDIRPSRGQMNQSGVAELSAPEHWAEGQYKQNTICITTSISPVWALDLCSRVPLLQMHFHGQITTVSDIVGAFNAGSGAKWLLFFWVLSKDSLLGRQASPVKFSHTRSVVWSQTAKFSKYFNEHVSDFFINF